MSTFTVVKSAARASRVIADVSFHIDAQHQAFGYLICNCDPLSKAGSKPRPTVLALHDERGDRSTLLKDLEVLVDNGFLCLAIDSPITRRAISGRDPFAAASGMEKIAAVAHRALRALPLAQNSTNPYPRRSLAAVIGRGLGGAVAAKLACESSEIDYVIAMSTLPNYSEFLADSTHPIAAGFRQYLGPDTTKQVLNDLKAFDLVGLLQNQNSDDQSTTDSKPIHSRPIHWMIQTSIDDDRLGVAARGLLNSGLPYQVRVSTLRDIEDLRLGRGQRERIKFLLDAL